MSAGNVNAAAALRAALRGGSALPVATGVGGLDAPISHPDPATAGVKRPRDDTAIGASQRSAAAVRVVPALDARGHVLPSLLRPRAALEAGNSLPPSSRHHDRQRGQVDLHAPDGGGRGAWFAADLGGAAPSAAAAGSAELRIAAGATARVVAELLREERTSGAGALDAALARNVVLAGGAYKNAELSGGGGRDGRDEGDEGAVDAIAQLMTGPPDARLTGRERQLRDTSRAVGSAAARDAAGARCALCDDSPAHAHALVISFGTHAMLMQPPGGPRVPGHLLLVPRAHVCALTGADDDVFAEINRFKVALHAHYSESGRDVLFLETALQRSGGGSGVLGRHTAVDVVPLDREVALDAPLFFRQALTDAEEWTTNASLIDTAGKGLRRCVPPGFSYFHVAWAGGGLVHPIEDTALWPPLFGLDVCAGMAGLTGGAASGRRRAEAPQEGTPADFREGGWARHDPTEKK